jgi:hypothetical protein
LCGEDENIKRGGGRDLSIARALKHEPVIVNAKARIDSFIRAFAFAYFGNLI